MHFASLCFDVSDASTTTALPPPPPPLPANPGGEGADDGFVPVLLNSPGTTTSVSAGTSATSGADDDDDDDDDVSEASASTSSVSLTGANAKKRRRLHSPHKRILAFSRFRREKLKKAMALYRGKEGEQILSFLVLSVDRVAERGGGVHFAFVASEDDIRFLQAVREDVRAHHYVRVREVLDGKTRVRRRTIDGVCFGDGENERRGGYPTSAYPGQED